MLMMCPPSRISGSARWVMKNGARTLIANSRSNCSRVAASMVASKVEMAALLTRMSSGRPARPFSSPSNSSSTSPSTPSWARTGNASHPRLRSRRRWRPRPTRCFRSEPRRPRRRRPIAVRSLARFHVKRRLPAPSYPSRMSWVQQPRPVVGYSVDPICRLLRSETARNWSPRPSKSRCCAYAIFSSAASAGSITGATPVV